MLHESDTRRPRQRKSTLPEDMVADPADVEGGPVGDNDDAPDDENYTLEEDDDAEDDDDDYEDERVSIMPGGKGGSVRGRPRGSNPRSLVCPKCNRVFTTGPCVVAGH